MPNSEKGFSKLVSIGILALLIIGGILFFINTKTENPWLNPKIDKRYLPIGN